MTILITGIAGFIGMHLTQQLITQNHQIIGIDNLNDYYDVALKKARLNTLLNTSPNIQFYNIDLIDTVSLNQLFEQNNIDMVIHLAAQAGVRHSQKAPNAFIQSNVIGFCNILEACRIYGVKKLLYASSSSVYGSDSSLPFQEKEILQTPTSVYAASKQTNELWAKIYSQQFGLKTVGLRFFSVYGAWGRPDMAYFSFTKSILAQKSITVFNHGKMQRDFTYIDDVIQRILIIIHRFDTIKTAAKIYNIGAGQPIALMDFITTLEALLGQKAQINWLPKQPEEMTVTYADMSKFHHDFGVQLPSTSLKTGLQAFINWYLKVWTTL